MNELMASIKDYILPNCPGIIDFPCEQAESQLYRLALIVTRNILDTYSLICRWFPSCNEKTCLELALIRFFPQHWLNITMQSNNHYLNVVSSLLDFYKLQLSDESQLRINTIVEYLCYEIIETAIIESEFIPISGVNTQFLIDAIQHDSVLRDIIQKHEIFIVNHSRINTNVLTPPEDLQDKISVKALKLIILYIRLRIKLVFENVTNPNQITPEFIESKFIHKF